MARSIIIYVILWLLGSTATAQGIRDSVFLIRDVEVSRKALFRKEQAGLHISVVDSSVLAEKTNLTLSELLSENTQMFIKNHGRGALATASFRGTSPSHTRVTWNGITLNSPMAGMVDFSLVPVYLVDELVLKHGPASISEAGGGIGGSIRIRNLAEWGEKNGIRYLQGLGSYRTFDEFLGISLGNPKVRLKTRIYHNYSANDFKFINREIGFPDPVTGEIIHPLDTNDHADYRRYGILQEAYFRLTPDQVVSVRYWGQYAVRTIPRPTSYEGDENSNLNKQSDRDHRFVADWTRYEGTGRWRIRSGFSSKELAYTLENLVAGLGRVTAINSTSKAQSLFNEASYTSEPIPGLSLEAALHLDYHRVNSAESVSLNSFTGSRSEVALYASASKSFAQRLNLNLMIRQEWYGGERAPVVPCFGFDLKLTRNADLILKGNVSRNHHFPSLNDLYWQPGGNPGLLPETGYGMEGGLEYSTRWKEQRVHTEVNLYRTDIRNWILWVPGFKGYWEPSNVARVLSKGVEFTETLSGKAGNLHYRISGNYACTRAINFGEPSNWGDASYGKQLVYVPLHSGNLFFRFTFRKIFLTYQYNAYSERFTTSSNDLTHRDRLYPYFMNDVSGGREFRLGKTILSAEIKIYNLFNESYRTVLYRPMPGRNFHLLLMFKL